MKKLIGGVILVILCMGSFVLELLTDWQPPNPSWQNPVIALGWIAILGFSAVLLVKGFEDLDAKKEVK